MMQISSTYNTKSMGYPCSIISTNLNYRTTLERKRNRAFGFWGIFDRLGRATNGEKTYSGNDRTIDLLRSNNIRIIEKMAKFEEDWNGNGAAPYSEQAINLFKKVINGLSKQPELSPTAADSIVMQYTGEGKTLYIHLGLEKTEVVAIDDVDYTILTEETIRNDEGLLNKLNREVSDFYGLELY